MPCPAGGPADSPSNGGEGALRLKIDADGPSKLRAEVIDQGVGLVPVARDRPAAGAFTSCRRSPDRWVVHEGSTHIWFEIER